MKSNQYFSSPGRCEQYVLMQFGPRSPEAIIALVEHNTKLILHFITLNRRVQSPEIKTFSKAQAWSYDQSKVQA